MYKHVQAYQWQTKAASKPRRKRFWRIKNIQSSIYYHGQWHLYGPIRYFTLIIWVICISSMLSLDIAKKKYLNEFSWLNQIWITFVHIWNLYFMRVLVWKGFWMSFPLIFRYVCIFRYKPTNDRQRLPPDQEEKDFRGSKTCSRQYTMRFFVQKYSLVIHTPHY